MADSKIFWKEIVLRNDFTMPAIGLGTYHLKGHDLVYEAVDQALASGYRLFDTGAIYGNESDVGFAFNELLKKHKLNRDKIFVITKISCTELGEKSCVVRAYQRSLKRMGLDFFDLCLVQCPANPKKSSGKKKTNKPKESTWAGIVCLYNSGMVNAIGVCNYSVERLKAIIANAPVTIWPVLNQLEINPLKYDKKLIAFCEQNDIRVQAYHTLGGVNSDGALLKNPQVIAIAKELEVTEAQVLLVWNLQKKFSVLPMSTNPEHIKENYEVNFKLNNEQMAILDNLSVKPKEKPPKPRKYHGRKNKR